MLKTFMKYPDREKKLRHSCYQFIYIVHSYFARQALSIAKTPLNIVPYLIPAVGPPQPDRLMVLKRMTLCPWLAPARRRLPLQDANALS
jgi:hypothetical protein